jgi:cytidine deaminase
METTPLTDDDRELIETVTDTNERAFDPDFFDGGHVVAAGVRTRDGAVYTGVSLPTAIGRASLCAEPVAIGNAIADGYSHDQIQTSVAVAYPLPAHDTDEQRVIPPCGVCREMLADYNPEMRVIVPVTEDIDGPSRDETPDSSSSADQDNCIVDAEGLLPVRTW